MAEGVETTEQYELLRALQIDHAQGYLFGKAVSGENAEALVREPAPLLEALECAFQVAKSTPPAEDSLNTIAMAD